jgi:hypothetical protein
MRQLAKHKNSLGWPAAVAWTVAEVLSLAGPDTIVRTLAGACRFGRVIDLPVVPVADAAAAEADHGATLRDGHPPQVGRVAIYEAGPLCCKACSGP